MVTSTTQSPTEAFSFVHTASAVLGKWSVSLELRGMCGDY
jgi:hypothetical protein